MAGKQDLQRSAIERFAQIEAERRALETESMLALLSWTSAADFGVSAMYRG